MFLTENKFPEIDPKPSGGVEISIFTINIFFIKYGLDFIACNTPFFYSFSFYPPIILNPPIRRLYLTLRIDLLMYMYTERT